MVGVAASRSGRRGEGSRYEAHAPARAFELEVRSAPFDRMAFALRALDVLRPKVTVVLYPRSRWLDVERPLDTSRRDGARAAVVGIPPYATREQIAVALLDAVGREPEPWLVATLAALPGADPPG